MDSSVIEKIRKLNALAQRAGTPAEGYLAASLMLELCRKYNIDPHALFGRHWRRPSTGRAANELRSEREQRVHQIESWTEVVERFFGPCLACSTEIQYVVRGYRWGIAWVKEQFENATRVKLLESLQAGKVDSTPTFSALHAILCQACIDKFAGIRDKNLREVESKRKLRAERREQKLEHAVWLKSWRKPNRGEFKRTDGVEFFYVFAEKLEFEVVFRWRISNRCQCRGNDPGAAVGVWVDGRSVAHYYGWDLATGKSEDYWSCGYERQDRFGRGFRVWFEKFLQPQLFRAKPDLSWSVLDSNLMEDVGLRAAWLVHVTWHDGCRYAKVGPLPTVEDAAKFAANRLQMQILRSDGWPVWPKEQSAAEAG